MTGDEYKLLLQDPRWRTVRLNILKRDKYRCKRCKASNVVLHVHHRLYLKDRMPWDVPNKYLITLCENCHIKAHENKIISSFVKSTIPSNQQRRIKNRSKPKIWIEGKGLVDAP